MDDYSSANSFWMLTLIIVAVCIISASILIVLICTRQRLRKAANAQLRARGPAAKGAMKRITLNGAAIERYLKRREIFRGKRLEMKIWIETEPEFQAGNKTLP